MNIHPALSDAVTDERAWRGNIIDPAASWTYPLSNECLAALDQVIRDTRGDSRPITEIPIQAPQLAGCRACLQPVLDALNSGRGFAIVERLPVEQYAGEESLTAYWAIGQLLGLPFEQNIQGTLLYDVRDTGQDVSKGVRFSVTKAESSFHNDNAFSPQVPDFVGLLCRQTAQSGGQSQLISAYALHNELLANHWEVLDTLYQPFFFDRRGQFRAGEPAVTRGPIFYWDGQELNTRYLHYYIQVGHQGAGQPFSPEQTKALEIMEALLRQPEFRVEFSLRPGQMLFTNNHWILHNRTAFEDYPEPERRRHYVRLWLNRKGTTADA